MAGKDLSTWGSCPGDVVLSPGALTRGVGTAGHPGCKLAAPQASMIFLVYLLQALKEIRMSKAEFGNVKN